MHIFLRSRSGDYLIEQTQFLTVLTTTAQVQSGFKLETVLSPSPVCLDFAGVPIQSLHGVENSGCDYKFGVPNSIPGFRFSLPFKL